VDLFLDLRFVDLFLDLRFVDLLFVDLFLDLRFVDLRFVDLRFVDLFLDLRFGDLFLDLRLGDKSLVDNECFFTLYPFPICVDEFEDDIVVGDIVGDCGGETGNFLEDDTSDTSDIDDNVSFFSA